MTITSATNEEKDFMRNTYRDLGTIFTLFVLLVAAAGFERLTSAQKPIKHPDGSTTTTTTADLGFGKYGIRKPRKTRTETQPKKKRKMRRVTSLRESSTVRMERSEYGVTIGSVASSCL